jgi:hypothetical protein
MWMNSLRDNINNDFQNPLLSYTFDSLVVRLLLHSTQKQYLVCMSCDSYQPTNLEKCVTPKLHKCDIVFVCSLPWYWWSTRTERYGYLHEQVQKVNNCKFQNNNNNNNSRSQDSRGDSQMNCWFMILNSAAMRVFVSSISVCLLNRKKVALKCKEIPSHSRLRMNSSKNLVIHSYAIYYAFSSQKLMDAN